MNIILQSRIHEKLKKENMKKKKKKKKGRRKKNRNAGRKEKEIGEITYTL